MRGALKAAKRGERVGRSSQLSSPQGKVEEEGEMMMMMMIMDRNMKETVPNDRNLQETSRRSKFASQVYPQRAPQMRMKQEVLSSHTPPLTEDRRPLIPHPIPMPITPGLLSLSSLEEEQTPKSPLI